MQIVRMEYGSAGPRCPALPVYIRIINAVMMISPPHAEYVYGGMYRQVSDLSVRAYIRIINTGGYVHEWEYSIWGGDDAGSETRRYVYEFGYQYGK